MNKAISYALAVIVFLSLLAVVHAQDWREYQIVSNTNCSLALCEASNGDEYFYFWMPESTATIMPDTVLNIEPITTTMYLKDVTPSKFALSFNTIKDWMLDNTDATLRIYFWPDDTTTIAGVGVCGKSGP